MNRMKFDAAVAGAGVAGCVFAGRLARAGFKVVVIESAARERLGHDWWDTVDLSIFPAIGIAAPRAPEARTPFSFNLSIEGRTLPVTSHMPKDMLNIERRLFAARLVKWAEEGGVEFRFGVRAVAPVFELGLCTGMILADGDVSHSTVSATLTVDASGINGVLRRAISPEQLESAGMQAEVAADATFFTYREVLRDTSAGGTSVICMDGTDSISWLSREPDGLVDVFAGVIGRNCDAGTVARNMVAREGGTGDSVRPGRRWTIPLRRPFDGLVLPGFMLIGDSACMANPANGSGVSIATRAAIIAADTAAKALAADDTSMSALWDYPARFFPQNAELAFLDAIKSFVFNAPRHAVLSFMAAGGIKGPAFWTMRHEFSFGRLLAKGGVFMRTKGGAELLKPMTGALYRGLLAESLYKQYPRRWDEKTFSDWRKRLPPT